MGGDLETDATIGDLSLFGAFEFKAFESRAKLEEYLTASDYATPSRPGMCFGFSITEEKNKSKYELEVFSNEKWPETRRFSPDSTQHEYLPYQAMPNMQSYV